MDVRDILEQADRDVPATVIAEDLPIGAEQVRRIIRGEAWSVDPPF